MGTCEKCGRVFCSYGCIGACGGCGSALTVCSDCRNQEGYEGSTTKCSLCGAWFCSRCMSSGRPHMHMKDNVVIEVCLRCAWTCRCGEIYCSECHPRPYACAYCGHKVCKACRVKVETLSGADKGWVHKNCLESAVENGWKEVKKEVESENKED